MPNVLRTYGDRPSWMVSDSMGEGMEGRMPDLRYRRSDSDPVDASVFLTAHYVWAPRDLDRNAIDPRFLPKPRPFTYYLAEVERTTRITKYWNRFMKGVHMSRGDDKPHKGNHGQHKATGKQGQEMRSSIEAMERIRQGQENVTRNQATAEE